MLLTFYLQKLGPNMMLEAIRSVTAGVVTGHIKGQENHNYEFITDNGFGIKCEEPDKLYEEIKDLIESNKLQECLNNILKFEMKNGADVVVEYIKNHIK